MFGVTPGGERPITARSRYERLSQERDTYLTRARECGKLTIPTLIPPEGGTGGNVPNEKIKTPYQSLGAKGVNTLAAKFLMALFPPNTPMFKMSLLDFGRELEEGKVNPQWKAEVDTALSNYEQSVQRAVEASGDRPVIHEAFLHLLVAGNVLLYDGEGSPIRCFLLPSYVVKRDPAGNVVELLVEEEISPAVLPKDVLESIQKAQESLWEDGGNDQNTLKSDRLLKLHTHVKRDDDMWFTYQECSGLIIDGTEGSYPLDGCPWLPLRMYTVSGENYGRSYVENYLGDLKSLEGLSQAILEGSSISAKVVFLVDPTSITKAKSLQNVSNGGFVEGRATDVTALQVGKSADLNVAFQEKQDIERRLSEAFLLMDSIRRDAERVTAEEIRAVAQELESTLSGGYSILSQEFQLPYVKRKIIKLREARALPELPKDAVEPVVTTGFEALGRGNDKTKILGFMQTVAAAIGPESLQRYVNVSNLISRLAAADGIDTTGLIKSEEDVQAEAQAAMQAQQAEKLTSSLGPHAIKALSQASQAALGADQQQQAPPSEGMPVE